MSTPRTPGYLSRFLIGKRPLALPALLVYALVTIVITWPYAIHPGSTLIGGRGGDLDGGVSKFHELAVARQAPFLPGRLTGVNHPEGISTTWLVDLAAMPSAGAMWLGAVALGAVPMYGLFAFTSFVASAFSMFLLVRWLTGNARVALVLGLVFGFWPWAFSYANLPLGHGWVLVLLMWRMLVVARSPTIRNGVLAGLAVVFSLWWTQYWLLIGGVLYATLAAFSLVVATARHELRRQLAAQISAAAVVLVFLVGLAGISLSAGFADVPPRPASDTTLLSARPLMYLVPRGPLVSPWTQPFLETRYWFPPAGIPPGATAIYSPLYLGLSTIVLGLIGLAFLVRRLARRRSRALDDPAVLGGVAATAVTAIALLFSAPPEVSLFGHAVPLPGHFISEVTTVFRVTARFGQVVMLGLCVIAAIGLRSLAANRAPLGAGAVVVVALVVLSIDLWSGRMPTSRPTYPAIYSQLARAPAGAVAEYPLKPAEETPRDVEFNRQRHGHPLFNGYIPGSDSENRKLELQDLGDPRTPRVLAREGVRYVVLRRPNVIVRPPGLVFPDVGRPAEGLMKLGEDRSATLYEVVAKPATNYVLGTSGFTGTAGIPGRNYRWTAARTSELELFADCDRCSGTLTFYARSLLRPRRLIVRDSLGREAARAVVGLKDARVRVPVSFRQRTSVTLTTDPGPEPPPGETRTLGIYIHGKRLQIERDTAR